MTAILGLSAFYHDSAAALVVDGEIVAAAQEERFTRVKHDSRFPKNAVDYCLLEAGLTPAELDYVCFYEKPLRKFERLLETYLAFVPFGYRSFRQAIPPWLKQKLRIPHEIRCGLRDEYTGRLVFVEHHESHAASAFFSSPFDNAAIVTLDGVGEWATSCIGVGRGNRINLTEELRFPHSLGLLYSAFTYFTGFRVNSGEYKLMGLAPFGQPVYRDLILQRLIDLKEDGSFRMDMQYFNFCHGLTMTSNKFEQLFGGRPRHPESPITQREMDIAASIQAVTEEIMLRIAKAAHRKTGQSNLVLAGGVALNCVGNGRIMRESPFDALWIQPAAGDAGGALGAAQFVWHQLLNKPRETQSNDSQRGSLLGPAYTDDEIRSMLTESMAPSTHFETDDDLCDRVASLIVQGKVVGWFQGRMEFGPRALGSRSILADARNPTMQSTLNLKIKFRESFRPFAPIVLAEHASDYFEIPTEKDSPYMLLVASVREELRTESNSKMESQGIERLKEIRSSIPAVTHLDFSARIQTIDRNRQPLVHRLLSHFYEKTGCPVLVNTSFNVRGEPMVCTPHDAYRCFMMTEMDAVVIGRYLLLREEQPVKKNLESLKAHLDQFPLD